MASRSRRMSDQALLDRKDKDDQRRKTITGVIGKENPSAAVKATPGKTPKNKKLSLGPSSAFYFKGINKTPLEARLKKNPNDSFDNSLVSYNGSNVAAESSFLSSSSSEASDLLNQSVLSDTTEYTASNYVLAASSRQRLSDASRLELEVASRAPLAEASNNNNKNERRNTLPPGTLVQDAVPVVAKPRAPRTSLPTNMSGSVKNLLEKANALKERRLSNQSARRFSLNNSATSETRLSLPSLGTPASTRSAEKNTSSDNSELDVSASSIDNVFSDLMSPKEDEKTIATAVNTKASPASTLNSTGRSPEPAFASPKPLPDTIAFENNEELKAEATSPFRLKPNSHQKLTPTKLSQSPRRIPNPEATDSPAKRTRSALKAQASPVDSPAKNTRSAYMSDEESSKENIVDSPAKNTRSAAKSQEKKSPFEERLLTAIGSDEEESAKRKIELVEETTVAHADKRRRSSVSVARASISSRGLTSSLKKHRKASARKSVAFGSPEVAEYNITSPSMSMTPLPRHRAKEMYSLPDEADTMEIEADMQELLKQNEPVALNTVNAGRTPVPRRKSLGDEDKTVELEGNLSTLLGSVATEKSTSPLADESKDDMSVDSIDPLTLQDATVELEPSLGNFLKAAADEEKESPKGSQEEDHTVELEANLNDLLNSSAMPLELADSPLVNARQRRSSIASKRFSLAPASNFSISIEGDLESGEDSVSKDVSVSVDQSIVEESYDLRNKEVFEVAKLDALSLGSNADGMSIIDSFMNSGDALLVQETINAMFGEICNEIESTEEDTIDLDQMPVFAEDATHCALALQRFLRSSNKEEVEEIFSDLKESVKVLEIEKWQNWLVAAGESMKGAFDELLEGVKSEATQLDEMLEMTFQAEQALKEMADVSVKVSKWKSYKRRETEVIAAEESLARLESRLVNEQAKLTEYKASSETLSLSLRLLGEKPGLIDELNGLEESTGKSERSWENTKGLTKLRITGISDDNLLLSYVGPCPVSCISLNVRVSEGFPANAVANIDESLFPDSMKPSIRQIKASIPYLDVRSLELINSVSSETLKDPSHLALSIQNYNRYLSRMEASASEISYLARRYSATIIKDEDGKFEGLEVVFSGKNEKSKLSIFFSIPYSYPFGPVGVALDLLEGDADIDRLRHLMLKNAKPGFGYISRTCALVSAHLETR